MLRRTARDQSTAIASATPQTIATEIPSSASSVVTHIAAVRTTGSRQVLVTTYQGPGSERLACTAFATRSQASTITANTSAGGQAMRRSRRAAAFISAGRQ